MWRALAIFLSFLVVACFEFAIFPGHSYLVSESQLYVPVLQHLREPGYLSRDLVASHPYVAYTVYDEVTLFLRAAAKIDFRHALLGQQFLSRLAALLGLFLIARAAGLNRAPALAVAALVSLGTYLPGVGIRLFDPEPVPRAFATGFALLSLGWLVSEKPLLAALFAGIAFVYAPFLAAPLWLMLVAAFLFDKRKRGMLKPMLPVLLVFALLLANLVQLQQGTPDTQSFLRRFSIQTATIEKFRTPDLWVSLWPHGAMLLYVAMLVIVVWAVTRLWPSLNRPLRWTFLFLPGAALLSLPCGEILLESFRLSAILRIQPAASLLYLVALCWLACALAAAHAWKRGWKREAALWLLPCLAIFALRTATKAEPPASPAVSELAAWAGDNTWGSSVFLFADAGRHNYPGVFRAESRRSLWVDWESGRQMNYYVDLAPVWQHRWDTAMRRRLTTHRLGELLATPIDYYVLKRSTQLESVTQGRRERVRPVYVNGEFAAYEASTLRLVPGKLIVSLGEGGG